MATSRIQKTNTGDYDQIFALSQSYLNVSLKELYANEPSLHTLTVKNIGGSITGAVIGPPTISLDVTSGSSIAFYYLNIVTGKLFLRDSETGDWADSMPDDGFDLDGSVIAFKVGIGLEGINPNDPNHKNIINQIDGNPSDYRLSRLFMDLTSADISTFDESKSSLPQGVVSSNGNWAYFFSTWMTLAHKKNINTLGYSVDVVDPNAPVVTVAPTFQPTSTSFQTYAWHNETSGDVVQDTDANGGGNNCLLYLQQTGFAALPDPIRLSYSGNMVEDGRSGTLIISKKLFWDRWLLPELQILNLKTLLMATGAHCSGNEAKPDWEWHYLFGDNAAIAAGRTAKEQDPFYAWKPKTDGSFGFTFNDHTRAEDSGGIWGSKLGCYIDCTVDNAITFTPGAKGVINITGSTGCTVERDTTAAGTAHVWVKQTWHCDIDMTTISETTTNPDGTINTKGGLETKLSDLAKDPIYTKEDEPQFALQTAPTGIEDDIKNLLSSNDLQSVTKKIQDGLAGVHKFVLPGDGTFIMTNPTFNNHGDFLVDIKYEPTQVHASS